MRKERSDGRDTRHNLLVSACEVFATRGFQEATIAEICRKAKVNIAAANYHFGGKDTLYVESWRYAFDKSLKTYPPDGGVSFDAPVQARLRGWILSIMQRILDPESHDLDIVYKELSTPTGLLAGPMQESMEPIFRGLNSIIRELLGDRATEQHIRLCQMSIRAQCFGPLIRERRRKMVTQGPLPPGPAPILDDVETLADHVTRFSLAGIREIRDRIERGKIVGKVRVAKEAAAMHGGRS